MRALGLEPSLVRGKSPVPYQSGVTRQMSNSCCPDGMPGMHARKESNPQPSVLETAAPPWLERKKRSESAQPVVRAS